VRILCLANSIREGGRCVAGIDYATGRWVRPVLLGGGPIPVERAFVGNKYLEQGGRNHFAAAPAEALGCSRYRA
jgi:hypothetical protein